MIITTSKGVEETTDEAGNVTGLSYTTDVQPTSPYEFWKHFVEENGENLKQEHVERLPDGSTRKYLVHRKSRKPHKPHVRRKRVVDDPTTPAV